MLDLLPKLVGNTPGPALPDTGFSQLTQVSRGVHAFRNDFTWVSVAQLIQPETAAFRDVDGFFQQGSWVK